MLSRRAPRQLRQLAFQRAHLSTSVSAAVARSASAPFTVEPVTLRDPKAEEVRVRVVATGLCHTDVAIKNGGLCAFPIVLGHEGTGVVEEVGSAVTSVRKGDHVIMSYAACGTCPHCAIGKPSYCYEHGSLNFAGTHPDGTLSHSNQRGEKIFGSFFQQSSFATYAIANKSNVIKVDKSLPLAQLAPLGCGVQTGAGAVLNTLKAGVGSSLAVFGCGTVGLSAIMAAKVAGCTSIVAVDLNAGRLNLAKELGATHAVKLAGGEKTDDVVKLVKDAVPAGVDFSLDTTMNKHAVRAAFDSLKQLGVCGMIGAAPKTEVAVEMLTLLPGRMLRGIIQGDSVSSTFIPQLIKLNQQGRFPYEKLITYYNGLGELNKAVAHMHKGTAIKPVLKIADA